MFAVFTTIFSTSFSITGIVKLAWSKENIVILLLCTCLAANGVVGMIVGVGGLVEVYRESKYVLWNLKKYTFLGSVGVCSRFEHKWRLRFYRSCSLIKIKMGSNNFMEELTPLNLINNAIALSVQLILIQS